MTCVVLYESLIGFYGFLLVLSSFLIVGLCTVRVLPREVLLMLVLAVLTDDLDALGPVQRLIKVTPAAVQRVSALLQLAFLVDNSGVLSR